MAVRVSLSVNDREAERVGEAVPATERVGVSVPGVGVTVVQEGVWDPAVWDLVRVKDGEGVEDEDTVLVGWTVGVGVAEARDGVVVQEKEVRVVVVDSVTVEDPEGENVEVGTSVWLQVAVGVGEGGVNVREPLGVLVGVWVKVCVGDREKV